MKTILSFFIILTTISQAIAQAPEKMSFQAVVRDASDVLITDTTVGMQISILVTSPTGTAVYVETQTPTTNANGLVSLEVGAGAIISGDFSIIDWGVDSYFIKTEIDPTGGTSYSIEGTSQLLSVPYALYAKNGGGTGNTLDQAYNQEMTTSPTPRTIHADDGKIEIIATDNIGLELTSDPDHVGMKLNATGDAKLLTLDASGDGDAMSIDQSGTGSVLDLRSSDIDNFSTALRLTNEGRGIGVEINNIEPLGDYALYVENWSAAEAIRIDNSNSAGGGITLFNEVGGDALSLFNEGGGKGIELNHAGAGTALHLDIDEGSTGIGLDINYGDLTAPLNGNLGPLPVARINAGAACVATATEINNAGTGKAVHITNGNPANASETVKIVQESTGTGLFIENGGPGKAAHFFNGVPVNAAEVLLANTAGLGTVGLFQTEDNDGNSASTLVANNKGNGSAGEFLIMDDGPDKENDKPIIMALSNGTGPGVFIDISNMETGVDINSEPAIFSSHKGYGNGAFLETTKADNTSATLEIKNNGAGHAAHLDSYDNATEDVESTLYVEQGNTSSEPTKGRTAVFDLHSATTAADAAVLIRSGALDGGHSALVVIPADPTKKAASFEGNVDIASDLVVGDDIVVGGDVTIGGLMSAAAKAFKIDHPLDPTNKYLVHNSIESNERVNIYSGNITTNEDGIAAVSLPEYMSALNRDFKYQLTIVDKTFAQAIIWEPVNAESNNFIIKTNEPNIAVSWQITGTRQDTWALANPMQVEVEKNNGF